MRIQIKDNWYVISDTNNIILSKLAVTKTGENIGEEYFVNVSFHNTVGGALDAYKNQKIRDSEAESFEALVREVEKIHDTIKQINEKAS